MFEGGRGAQAEALISAGSMHTCMEICTVGTCVRENYAESGCALMKTTQGSTTSSGPCI